MNLQDILRTVDENMREFDQRLKAVTAAHNNLVQQFVTLAKEHEVIKQKLSMSVPSEETVTVNDVKEVIFNGPQGDAREVAFHGLDSEAP